MINIDTADYDYISIYQSMAYNNMGKPELRINVGLNPTFKQDLEKMKMIVREWEKHQLFIQSNPAIKASWESFMTMSNLAKEPA